MSFSPAPDEIKTQIDEALDNLNSPEKLSESKLLSLCMVVKYAKEHPAVLPYQALKAVLTDTLNLLEKEDRYHADILRGRFWEGLSPTSMIASGRPKQWSPKSFYNYQKKARSEFYSLLWQKEQNCKADLKPAAAINGDKQLLSIQPDNPPKTNHSTRANILPTMLLAVLIISVISATVFLVNNRGAQAQPVPTFATAFPTATLLNILATPASATSICGDAQTIPVAPSPSRFLRSQGVSSFNTANTPGLLNNKVRSLAIDQSGLWIGTLGTDEHPTSGLAHYDKVNLLNCGLAKIMGSQNINALAVSTSGKIWVGTQENGITSFDGREWHLYTTHDGLPSNQVYSLTMDDNDNLWAGTWEGVAKFDGATWSVPYRVENATLSNNHVHAVAFDGEKNIWVGHINSGVSEYRQMDSRWVSYDTSTEHGLAGNQVRKIIIRPKSAQQPESIWFATADGGVSRFEQGKWTAYRVEDGLPDNAVSDLALDRYNRIWAATDKGVSYFDDKIWKRYTTLETLAIAIGKSCLGTSTCPFDDDVVWTGTRTMGLTHSRLPLPVPAIKVQSICFETSQKGAKKCVQPASSFDTSLSESMVTATFPEPLKPGEKLHFEITVSPEDTYQLREGKGDFLSNTDDDDFNLFHAYPIIKVHGIEGILKTVEPGEPYTFTDYDNPFVAPQIPDGVQEKQFTSTWRVWMYTRYVGPYIRLVFTVKK